jgi:hypothetical protein
MTGLHVKIGGKNNEFRGSIGIQSKFVNSKLCWDFLKALKRGAQVSPIVIAIEEQAERCVS